MEAALAAVQACLEEPPPGQLFLVCLEASAARLATALLRYWALPDVVAAAAAEMAMAATARSCAYLRCSNVELQGGPAARQGAGTKRCSACRVASYCSAVCSRADWRWAHEAGYKAGHKFVCAALGAARAAEQQ